MTIKKRLEAFWRFMSGPRAPSDIPAGESETDSNAPQYVAEYEYSEDGDIIDIDGEGFDFGDDPAEWHKTAELDDGSPIGKAGAVWHLLDENGRSISLGYHEIELRHNSPGYVGEIGGNREAFNPEQENENND